MYVINLGISPGAKVWRLGDRWRHLINYVTSTSQPRVESRWQHKSTAEDSPLYDMISKSPDSPVRTDVSLGELTSTERSFLPALILQISSTSFTWGRARGCAAVYNCPNDTRVPKKAFQISWYTPTTASRSERKRERRRRSEDGEVVITTYATYGIQVNKQLLTEYNNRGYRNYGFLRTGDIITIFRDENTRLEFVCKFYYGQAQHTREPMEQFQIFADLRSRHDSQSGSAGL